MLLLQVIMAFNCLPLLELAILLYVKRLTSCEHPVLLDGTPPLCGRGAQRAQKTIIGVMILVGGAPLPSRGGDAMLGDGLYAIQH